MKWTIGSKIGGLIVLPIVVLVLLSVTYYQMSGRFLESAELTEHTYEVLEHQELFIALMTDAETGQRGYLLSGMDSYLDPYNNALVEVYNELNKLKDLTSDNPNQQKRLERIKELVDQKFDELKETIDLRRNEGFNAALNVVLSDRGKAVMDNIRRIHNEIIEEEQALLEQRHAGLVEDSETINTIIIFGSLISALLIIVLGVTIVRNISTPLKEITETAKKIASGDLTVELDSKERSDEVGILQKSFQSMITNLKSQVAKILDGVNVLVSSTAQISSTISELTASSNQTVTAVNETSTTVDEVKQTAKVAKERANEVTKSSEQAMSDSAEGETAVNEMSQKIQNIKSQMGLIAESITELSEQGASIGEIMNTINELAEQSNLLAVNAAIEAAKAGDSGKGFAVVANEVRSLAEQSKQATQQVRTILNDVQKAASKSVMATEEGGKTVEQGVEHVDVALEKIQVLAKTIEESSQSALQIAASSQQQFVGIDQINIAVKSINEASTQNLSSAKQLNQAADNLKDLGEELKKVISFYNV